MVSVSNRTLLWGYMVKVCLPHGPGLSLGAYGHPKASGPSSRCSVSVESTQARWKGRRMPQPSWEILGEYWPFMRVWTGQSTLVLSCLCRQGQQRQHQGLCPARTHSYGREQVERGSPEGPGWELGPGLLLCLPPWKGVEAVCPSLHTSPGQSKAPQKTADGL